MMIKCYRPDTGEETLGLVAETRLALTQDMRIAREMISPAGYALYCPPRDGNLQDVFDPATESPVEYLGRVWGHVLPGRDNAERVLRKKLGWSRDELFGIYSALEEGADVLYRHARGEVIVGKETLERDAGLMLQLRTRWYSLYPGQPLYPEQQ